MDDPVERMRAPAARRAKWIGGVALVVAVATTIDQGWRLGLLVAALGFVSALTSLGLNLLAARGQRRRAPQPIMPPLPPRQ